MGGITFDCSVYISTLAEIAGYKAGIGLSLKQLAKLVKSDDNPWPRPADPYIRMRAEEYESTVHDLLHRLGHAAEPERLLPSIELSHKYRNDPARLAVLKEAVSLWSQYTEESALAAPGQPIDLRWFMPTMKGLYGELGEEVGGALFDSNVEWVETSPWNRSRRVAWPSAIPLDDLFNKENIRQINSQFFDQRFIDYLSQNFPDIDRVHWRQFEKLAAEYLSRVGFSVDLGKGRADGGVDMRAAYDAEDGSSVTILVQCKRVRGNLDHAVFKALHDDVQIESATGGLLVTTSTMTKGHHAIMEARLHRIEGVDRNNVRRWIADMRTQRYPLL